MHNVRVEALDQRVDDDAHVRSNACRRGLEAKARKATDGQAHTVLLSQSIGFGDVLVEHPFARVCKETEMKVVVSATKAYANATLEHVITQPWMCLF